MARTATSRLRTQVVTEENGCAYQDYHGWWMREDDGLWHYRSVHGRSDNGIASPFGNAPVEIRIIRNFWHWVELPKATAPAHPTSGEGGGGGVNEDPYSEYRIEAEHRAMTPTPPTERAERDWPGPQNYIGVCAKCDEQYSGSDRDVIGLTCYACYLAFASQAPTPPEPVAGAVTHDQARESLQRLCNSHFRKEPCARVSIPARPEWDDDLILHRYIKQQAARARCLEVACRTIRPMSGHDAFDLEAAIRTAFAQDAEGQEGGGGLMTLSELIVNQSTRVAELEAENERLHLINETLVKRCDELYKERDDLATRLQKYEAALHLYGRHLHDCSEDHDCKACSCGFRAALTPAPASASEEMPR